MTTATATRLDTFLEWTRNLRLREIRVLAAIDLEARGGDGWVEITLEDLCAWVGMTAASVSAAVSELEQRGYIEVGRDYRDGFGGGRMVNEYRVLWER